MRRGLQRQPHDVVDLRLSVRVGAELERLDPMWLQRVGAPNPMDRHVRHTADLLGEIARAPVGDPGRGRLQRQRDDAGGRPAGYGRRTTGSRTVLKAGESLFTEALPNATDLHRCGPGLSRDLGTGHVVSHQQHRSRPSNDARGGTRRSLQPQQFPPLVVGQGQRPCNIRHRPPTVTEDMARILI